MNNLKVRRIENGTVIDHIPHGKALVVLKILGITENENNTIAVLMNVESKKLGKKDIVKIENRELTEEEVNMISLIAPSATINIIRQYEIAKKFNVRLPKEIKGILKCPNPNCVTNATSDIKTHFLLVSENPIKLKCRYCWTYLDQAEILRQLSGLK